MEIHQLQLVHLQYLDQAGGLEIILTGIKEAY